MDHLAELLNPPDTAAHVHVPYYGGIYDDEEDWYSFPKRQGWTVALLEDGDLHGHSWSELQAFLQAWLYLGLLCHLLQEPFASISRKYIRIDAVHGPLIDSQHLPDDLVSLAKRTNKEKSKEIEMLLAFFVDRQCYRILKKNTICPAILCSIAIFSEGLSLSLSIKSGSPYIYDFLQCQLQATECCPALFAELLHQVGLSGIYLRILQEKSSLPHRHSVCEEQSCNALTVNEHCYQATHSADCLSASRDNTSGSGHARCPMIEINHEEIVKTLRLNTFPIVCINTDRQKPVIKVRPFEEGSIYVAVSHVSVSLSIR